MSPAGSPVAPSSSRRRRLVAAAREPTPAGDVCRLGTAAASGRLVQLCQICADLLSTTHIAVVFTAFAQPPRAAIVTTAGKQEYFLHRSDRPHQVSAGAGEGPSRQPLVVLALLLTAVPSRLPSRPAGRCSTYTA